MLGGGMECQFWGKIVALIYLSAAPAGLLALCVTSLASFVSLKRPSWEASGRETEGGRDRTRS